MPWNLADAIALSPLIRRHVCDEAQSTTDVILLANRDHVSSLRPLFVGVSNVRFLFVGPSHVPGPEWDVIQLPRAKTPVAVPRSLEVNRNEGMEGALVHAIRQKHGDGYILAHGPGLRTMLFPNRAAVVWLPPPSHGNVFDWIGVIEHATELHAVDSCYLVLADALSLRPRKFLHSYASAQPTRKYSPDIVSIV